VFRAFAFLSVVLAGALSVVAAGPADVRVQKDVMVPMRDGVELAANVTLPSVGEKFPVILVRTPYGKDNDEDDVGAFWAEQGYAFVIQDCRGTGNSQGGWYPMVNERRDGLDTLDWVLAQPWCNGQVGTSGGSYLGYTQWAIAPYVGEQVKAMFTIVPMIEWYKNVAYCSGAFRLQLNMGWGSDMLEPTRGEGAGQPEDWDLQKAYWYLPLSRWDEQLGRRVDFMRDWVAHPEYDEYWARQGLREDVTGIRCPVVVVSGWYDIFISQAFEYVSKLRTSAESETARRHCHLLVGPWGHGPNWFSGERQYGDDAEVDVEQLQSDWFRHWLKGEDTGVEDWPAYRIFVMGVNQWRDEQEWPLARTVYTPYYFHSEGSASTLAGDGGLDTQQPRNEPADLFIYDPAEPVPTAGGCNMLGMGGSRDQREVEKRKDVLVYTSDVLQEPLEVTGPVKVVLYASSSATDTDWTAKLVDVEPDGRAFNLCDGIIRARFRNGDTETSLIRPGKVYRYDIDLWVTSNVFLPGHRIRVEISSSNFPRFDRNPNTGHKFGADAELQKATQTVYHDQRYPSHILLPVIPPAQ